MTLCRPVFRSIDSPTPVVNTLGIQPELVGATRNQHSLVLFVAADAHSPIRFRQLSLTKPVKALENWMKSVWTK
jgi:hypothetical protein